MDLTPIKIRIGLNPKGHAAYPNFNALPIVAASGMDWSYYVDANGGGWHYDKVCGHADQDTAADSPMGMQWGCLLVPPQFAKEAIDAFPADITEMTEAEFEDFHDNRAHKHESDLMRDRDALEAAKTQRDLMAARAQDTAVLDAELDKALDPGDPTPGVRRNRNKQWAMAKADKGVSIVKSSA